MGRGLKLEERAQPMSLPLSPLHSILSPYDRRAKVTERFYTTNVLNPGRGRALDPHWERMECMNERHLRSF